MTIQKEVYAVGRLGMTSASVDRERDAHENGGEFTKISGIAQSFEATKLIAVLRLSPAQDPIISLFVDLPPANFLSFTQAIAQQGLAHECRFGTSVDVLRRAGVPTAVLSSRDNGKGRAR